MTFFVKFGSNLELPLAAPFVLEVDMVREGLAVAEGVVVVVVWILRVCRCGSNLEELKRVVLSNRGIDVVMETRGVWRGRI